MEESRERREKKKGGSTSSSCWRRSKSPPSDSLYASALGRWEAAKLVEHEKKKIRRVKRKDSRDSIHDIYNKIFPNIREIQLKRQRLFHRRSVLCKYKSRVNRVKSNYRHEEGEMKKKKKTNKKTKKSWKMLVFSNFPYRVVPIFLLYSSLSHFLFYLIIIYIRCALLFLACRRFLVCALLPSRVRRRHGERRSNTLGTEWDAGSQICAAGRFPTPWQPPTARPS